MLWMRWMALDASWMLWMPAGCLSFLVLQGPWHRAPSVAGDTRIKWSAVWRFGGSGCSGCAGWRWMPAGCSGCPLDACRSSCCRVPGIELLRSLVIPASSGVRFGGLEVLDALDALDGAGCQLDALDARWMPVVPRVAGSLASSSF